MHVSSWSIGPGTLLVWGRFCLVGVALGIASQTCGQEPPARLPDRSLQPADATDRVGVWSTLLSAWSAERPQPRSQMGHHPQLAGAAGSFYELNVKPYALLGDVLGSSTRWEDIEALLDRLLERSDGQCNLPIAYATGHAAVAHGEGNLFLQRIDDVLAQESTRGDIRVTWLLAQAYAQAVLVERAQPRIERGLESLQEALLVAASPAYRFWALQELVARRASLNQGQRAQALIDDYQGDFTAPDQQAALRKWRRQTDQLAADYVYLERVQQTKARQLAQQQYIEELETRLRGARQREDPADIQRYRGLLENARAQSTQSQSTPSP